MKRLIHKIMMRIIPWKLWGWRSTSRLMRINFWANREEFERMAIHGSDHLTTRALAAHGKEPKA